MSLDLQIIRINLYPVFKELKAKYGLTKRETQVIEALTIYGENNHNLGSRLKVSENTIKNHMSRILVKTKLSSARELQALILRSLMSFE
ncbi:LuxR C-terminal-related transcriptional regulator [Paenibacillus sp. PDC88]|uniref:helix-turn-helix transcriptional regulator n=1 Tax=Paenibacillus sp. PDC88 TaxID=1884375 RepID=UPI000898EFD5|nr:LuxR C-terminal-related transcriptional regulator [Paenibacillus sp. PDC88]SDX88507.1 regulatory protein, luxR family [Paenibacillus sp. PDC88]